MKTVTLNQLGKKYSVKERKTRAMAINDSEVLSLFADNPDGVLVFAVKKDSDDVREKTISTNTVYTFLRRHSNLFYKWVEGIEDGLLSIAFSPTQHEDFKEYIPKVQDVQE